MIKAGNLAQLPIPIHFTRCSKLKSFHRYGIDCDFLDINSQTALGAFPILSLSPPSFLFIATSFSTCPFSRLYFYTPSIFYSCSFTPTPALTIFSSVNRITLPFCKRQTSSGTEAKPALFQILCRWMHSLETIEYVIVSYCALSLEWWLYTALKYFSLNLNQLISKIVLCIELYEM